MLNTYPSNPWPLSTEQKGGGGGSYELPIASAETLGGVMVGEGLEINAETGVLSASGGTSGSVNYSTTEHAVGTWLDGKTLYERTYNIFLNGEAQYPIANSEYDIGLTGIETAFVYGVVGERQIAGVSQYVDWGNAPGELIIVLNKTVGKVYINPKSHTYNNFYVTIRYTKAGA